MYEEYVKGVKKPSQAYFPNVDLRVLAVQSGGRVLVPSNDLAAEIESCVQDASAFYTISFAPPPADGPDEYHELKIRVGKPGLTARTNTGYYNGPLAAEQVEGSASRSLSWQLQRFVAPTGTQPPAHLTLDVALDIFNRLRGSL